MLFPDTNHPWDTQPLGKLFRLATVGLNPKNCPREEFYHYSIPAWDELGGPTLDFGKNIDSGKFLLRERCILVSKLNPQISRVRQFAPPQDGRRACASTEIMAYVPLSEDSNLAFFTHYMRSEQFRRNLIAAATGTTNSHKRVRPPQTLEWVVPVPTPDEQIAIAQILDAVDTAIERTREAMERARQVRKSLLHDLLSRGVDKNGGVRNPSRQPHKFAKTPLGRLPSDWTLSVIGKEFDLQNGFTLNEDRKPRYRKRPYLRVANVQRDALDLQDIQELEANDVEFAPRVLKVDDLLVVEGHADRMQIGRCAKITEEAQGLTFQNHLFRLRASGQVLPYFSCLWLNSTYAQRYWNARCATSSGLNTINQRMLKRMIIPVPPEPEQKIIAAVVAAQRKHLESLVTKHDRLASLKISLMHDLLTGKVRVNNLNLDKVAAL